MQISKSGRRRKTASLYNGAKLRVWDEKTLTAENAKNAEKI